MRLTESFFRKEAMLDVTGRLAVFANQDGVELAGFAIGHERPRSGLGVLYLHGKGGNFYTGPSRFMPVGLADENCLHLSMNMRCHDIGYTRYDVVSPDISVGGATTDGGAWERTSEGWKDIDAGIDYLRGHGCTRIVLVGHSSGGLYTGLYPDEGHLVVGRVFLSPLISSKTAFQIWFPAQEDRDRAQATAHSMVSEGRGEQLIPLRTWYWAISARSLLERIAEPDDYFESALQRHSCPLLVIWGGQESRVEDWKRTFGSLQDRECLLYEIAGAEHHYAGFEDHAVAQMREFLRRL